MFHHCVPFKQAPAAAVLLAALIFTTDAFAEAIPEKFAPLPETSHLQEEPEEGYRVQKVGASSFVVLSGATQAVFIVTNDGVVVIDAPPPLAEKLPAAIKKTTDKPVRYLIYSHSHYDHIGAAAQFKGAKIIAHEETAKLLKAFPDPDRPLPQETFGDKKTLKIGGRTIELIYPGPNHETGNIIIFVPQDRLAVMIDLVMPGWAPYRAWGNADMIPGILRAHDALLKLDFDTYVGGHVYRTGTKKDVEDSREFARDLWNETGKTMGEVPFGDAMSKVEPGNAWAAQYLWFDMVATRVTDTLVKKWKERLAGIDTFTHDTVIATIISRATDQPKGF